MMDCYDFNCQEYKNIPAVSEAVKFFTERKIERIEMKYNSISDFLAILYYFWFVKEEEVSQIAETLDENVSYIYSTFNLLQWYYSHNYEENVKLSKEYDVKLKTIYTEAKNAINNYDFEKHDLYCSALKSDYYKNMLKKTYASIGFKDKVSYLKFMFYLVRVRPEALTTAEIGKLLKISDSAAGRRLRELGIALSKEEATANMIVRGRKDMQEILKKGRKTVLKSKESISSSISENRFRLLLSERIRDYFGKQYEMIVGVNTFGILGDLEIDIPIIVLDLLNRAVYKFCVEYNGVYYHNEVHDVEKAIKAQEKGWYYIPVYEGKGGIKSDIDSLTREADRVCKAVYEIVMKGNTEEKFNIIHNENQVISDYVKFKSGSEDLQYENNIYDGYVNDEIKLEILKVVKYKRQYKVIIVLENLYDKDLSVRISNLIVFNKRISEYEETYDIEKNTKKLIILKLEIDLLKGLKVQTKGYLSLKFDYRFFDSDNDIIEEREYAKTVSYIEEDLLVLKTSNNFIQRSDKILSKDNLMLTFLEAYNVHDKIYFLCELNNESEQKKEIYFEYLECEGIYFKAYCNATIIPMSKQIITISVEDTIYFPIEGKSVKFIARDNYWKWESRQYEFIRIKNLEIYDKLFAPEIEASDSYCYTDNIIGNENEFIIDEENHKLKYVEIENNTAAWIPNYKLKYDIKCAYLRNLIEWNVYINGLHFKSGEEKIDGKYTQNFSITLYENALLTYGVVNLKKCIVEVEIKMIDQRTKKVYSQQKFAHLF